ncbi:MAG: hypothetical protein KAH38_04490 [Candidatus Hydrogenedentes bacterium]|nr:hypothetical protein [Candidatus Hydrogenedentota bacterium]
MSDTSKLRRRAQNALKDGTPPPSIESANKGNLDKMVTTGSTLLDLAISGEVSERGGVPSGVLVEVFGASGSGKSALVSEMAGHAINNGGTAAILDPEGRLDHEHAKIYGLDMTKVDYSMPDTVTDIFEYMDKWEPATEEATNLIMVDSLAALSTNMEMKENDAMGMRRAKEFSEGLRKLCRRIKKNDWIVACTNQVRVNVKTGGVSTPGGLGVGFYSSIRIKIAPAYKNGKLKKVVTVNGTKQEKIYGVKSECTIVKSSVDAPFRVAPIFLVFDYGIDNLRANLLYLQENGADGIFSFKDFSCKTINKAIEYAEEHELETDIENRVITLWREIQRELATPRKRKKGRIE